MLTYRGIQYKPAQSNYRSEPSDTFGVYRGVQMRLPKSVHHSESSRVVRLIYRGAKYYARG